MNQIIYRDEMEFKSSRKKSKLIRALILISIGIVLLIGSFVIIKNMQNENTHIFIPEQTKLDLYIEDNNLIVESYNSQGLEKIIYKWDDKDSYTLYPKDEDNTILNLSIPILNGEHTIYIEIIDSNGNTITKKQKIKGATEAEIEITVEDGYFSVTVVDEIQLEKLEYEFNGKRYAIDVGDTGAFNFMKKLEYGKNNIKVVAKNSQGIYSTKELEYEY